MPPWVFPSRTGTALEERNGILKLWDLESGREPASVKAHDSGIKAVAALLDGQRVVSAATDRVLRLWDVASLRKLRTFSGHTHWVEDVAVTPDGLHIVSASNDNTVKIWQVDGALEMSTVEGDAGGAIAAMAVAPKVRRAIAASHADEFTLDYRIWDLASGPELRRFSRDESRDSALAISAEGRIVVSSSKHYTLSVWDAETGRTLRTFEGHDNAVDAAVITPDGRLVISASGDGTLGVWELDTGRHVRTLKGHSMGVGAVAVTPDGRGLTRRRWTAR